MSANFDITPEKQASLPRFFYRQLTTTPAAVVGDVGLQGQSAIVRGSNTGVGFEISRQLLDLGVSKLIFVVQYEDKGNTAVVKLLSDLRLTYGGT